MNGIHGYRITDKKSQNVYLDMDKGQAQIKILPNNLKEVDTLIIDFFDGNDKTSDKLYFKCGNFAALKHFTPTLSKMNEQEVYPSISFKLGDKVKLYLAFEKIGFTDEPKKLVTFSNPKSHSRTFEGKKNIWKLQLSTSSPNAEFDVNFVCFYNYKKYAYIIVNVLILMWKFFFQDDNYFKFYRLMNISLQHQLQLNLPQFIKLHQRYLLHLYQQHCQPQLNFLLLVIL